MGAALARGGRRSLPQRSCWGPAAPAPPERGGSWGCPPAQAQAPSSSPRAPHPGPGPRPPPRLHGGFGGTWCARPRLSLARGGGGQGPPDGPPPRGPPRGGRTGHAGPRPRRPRADTPAAGGGLRREETLRPGPARLVPSRSPVTPATPPPGAEGHLGQGPAPRGAAGSPRPPQQTGTESNGRSLHLRTPGFNAVSPRTLFGGSLGVPVTSTT